MLAETLAPEICDKVIATMSPVVRDKILRAFIWAIDSGADMLAPDGTSPAGEQVMSWFNDDMARQGWAEETRRMVRLNVRVIGLALIRGAVADARN